MRAAIVASIALAVTFTGCVAEQGLSGARTLTDQEAEAPTQRAVQAITCPSGSFLSGIDADGSPDCVRPMSAFNCPAGEFVNGFTIDGTPTCAPIEAPSPSCIPERAEHESNLEALNVYGVRPDSASNLETLKVNVELARGSVPIDITKFTLCYTTFGETTSYTWPGASTSSFKATWIRGSPGEVMLAEDLVEFELTLPHALGTRQDVALAIVPHYGAVIHADFRSPTTYGTDKVITLR